MVSLKNHNNTNLLFKWSSLNTQIDYILRPTSIQHSNDSDIRVTIKSKQVIIWFWWSVCAHWMNGKNMKTNGTSDAEVSKCFYYTM